MVYRLNIIDDNDVSFSYDYGSKGAAETALLKFETSPIRDAWITEVRL